MRHAARGAAYTADATSADTEPAPRNRRPPRSPVAHSAATQIPPESRRRTRAASRENASIMPCTTRGATSVTAGLPAPESSSASGKVDGDRQTLSNLPMSQWCWNATPNAISNQSAWRSAIKVKVYDALIEVVRENDIRSVATVRGVFFMAKGIPRRTTMQCWLKRR